MLRRVVLCVLLIVFTSATFLNAKKIQAKTEYNPLIIDTVEIKPDLVTLLKDEIRYTRHWDEGCSDNTIQVTYEEAQMLMQIAYSEAGNQGVEGQLAVMEVVWNRVNSDNFPDSIKEVIEQPGHFSSVSNGTYYTLTPNVDSHLALAEFEKNLHPDDNVIGFESNSNGSLLLQYYDFYEVIGDHTFYKLKTH